MGEVMQLAAGCLTVRVAATTDDVDTVMIRDAVRNTRGLLETARPFAALAVAYAPPSKLLPDHGSRQGPRRVARVGGVDAALVNGVFGDPMLHVRLRHQARRLLFDLGDGRSLSARVAHQVSDGRFGGSLQRPKTGQQAVPLAR